MDLSAGVVPEAMAVTSLPESKETSALAAVRAGRDRGDASPTVEKRTRGVELRELGWSNKRIARELDVHPSTVGRWFTGVHLSGTTDREEKS